MKTRSRDLRGMPPKGGDPNLSDDQISPDISPRFDFGPLRAELTVMVRVGAL